MKNFPKIWVGNLWNRIRANDKVVRMISTLGEQSRPLIERWQKFTDREKQLLIGLLGVFVIIILYLVVSSGIGIVNKLNDKYSKLQAVVLSSEYLNNEYNDLNTVSANEFSSVSLSRVEGDVKQALDVNNANVVLQDSVLVIKVDNVMFESVMLLLDQLRKSYGIFPSKLDITQSRSGYVNLNVSFAVSQ